ncbi:hypothetical protein [Bifidobacterium biavatii]|uniref:Ig-like domain-containing protein n=1 Tax=Bifidobacterium biavatii DSM 23969 TaxID=1437608 RepID=A0A087A0C2_9BIFI|nr:hypothetical protein [Bifidobacterium biavatii]KFI52222.1 hypothetical protein BBIA_0517 [Bifidobacterium biavatii DSM 23969]
MTGDLLHAMAGDLGLDRMLDESDTRFACRVSYSALRFWIQAYCLDDGYGGTYGVSAPTIMRKSTIWLRNLEDLYPGLLNWYRFNLDSRKGLSDVLTMLTAVHDLVKTDDGLYRCTAQHTVTVSKKLTLILGMTDPTNLSSTYPISGMGFANKTGRLSDIPYHQFASKPIRGKAIIKPKDKRHSIIQLAQSLPESLFKRQFNLLTWPVLTAIDQQRRIARAEYVPILADMLHSNGILCQIEHIE